MDSYISSKTKKGLPSNIHGKGFFAIQFIKKDEIIAIKKGVKLTGQEMKVAGIGGGVGLQVDDDLYIAPATRAEFEASMIFINYSCNPNIGMKGDDTVVALRDIEAGEELTIDYAMIANDDSSLECNCGSKNCRHTITGKDWMSSNLQEKYKGYFTSYIQRKIDSARDAPDFKFEKILE